jgi:hypothetical protein
MKIRFLPFYGVPFSWSFCSEQYWSCSIQWWVIVCGGKEELLLFDDCIVSNASMIN